MGASPTVGAAAAMALAVLAYVVVRETRSRRARAAEASAPAEQLAIRETPTEPVAVPAEVPDKGATESADDVEPMWVRALHLHVRTLETTLVEQSASLAEARAQLDASSRGGGDMERVLLTVDALREQMKENPESVSVLNRVEAAVTRLSSRSALGRPALPARVPGARVALLPSTPPPVPPAAVTVAPAAEEVIPVPVPAAAPRAEAPTSDERVLPVPAPPAQDGSRGSRWRRRGTA
jgi:hypothetical protein